MKDIFLKYQLFIVVYSNSFKSLQDQPDTLGFYNLSIHWPLALVVGCAPLLVVLPCIVGAASGWPKTLMWPKTLIFQSNDMS